jgi:hypothetical protein
MRHVERTEILEIANKLIAEDRAITHGDAERNFTAIAGAWQAYLAGRAEITSVDVAAMMVILKMCRSRNNSGHLDSWIDGAGYSAIGGELAS